MAIRSRQTLGHRFLHHLARLSDEFVQVVLAIGVELRELRASDECSERDAVDVQHVLRVVEPNQRQCTGSNHVVGESRADLDVNGWRVVADGVQGGKLHRGPWEGHGPVTRPLLDARRISTAGMRESLWHIPSPESSKRDERGSVVVGWFIPRWALLGVGPRVHRSLRFSSRSAS